ncbi:MAG: DUF1624 domain-containing protein [Halobacteriovoraceae bacterium]|nr:DUF1624 domain-containing protein [Halobacteriovoraceae bacterium]
MDKIKKAIKFIFEDFYSPISRSDSRILIIDLFRFTAIVLMVIFHFGYDLNMFGLKEVNVHRSIWWLLPRIIISLFLLSSGLSLNLKAHTGIKNNLAKILPRAGKLGFFAAIITVVTFFIFPNNWVYFGTLHSLTACSLISLFFLGRSLAPLALGVIIQLNYFLDIIPFVGPLDRFPIKSVDHIPLYPWLGVFLIGLGLSPLVKKYSPRVPYHSYRWISIISQKSLPIYLLHQPLLVLTLFIFKSLFIS